MIQGANGRQQSDFSRWMRTGSLPPGPSLGDLELKFNPWHDPADGRFTFAGSGQYFGQGEGQPVDRGSGRARRGASDTLPKPRAAAAPKAARPRAGTPERPTVRGVTRAPAEPVAKPQLRKGPQPVSEFFGGVGEGLYGVAKETVEGVYSVLTTNPITTVRNTGRGIARTIDGVIAAENTPARVQISRAADAAANASARDLGRVTGAVVGNAALTTLPGAALHKISMTRRLAAARPRTTYAPAPIRWVNENLKSDKPWKVYNDSAPGARLGQAPALMRTMPDGSQRPVKFDGFEGDSPNDRKLRVVDRPRARDQVKRQTDVLAQHRLIGTWEVPNEAERIAALKLLKKMNVTNIKVRIVKP